MPTETYNPQRAGTQRCPVVWKTGGSLSGVDMCPCHGFHQASYWSCGGVLEASEWRET